MTAAPRPTATITALAGSDRRRSRRRVAKLGALGLAATALVASGVGGAPAEAANPLWGQVTWAAPITKAGPNQVAAPPTLAGTATPLLGGRPNRVDYSVAVPAGFPAACVVAPGTAALDNRTFTFTPAFRCNGSYVVSVRARTGSGLLASSSDPLKAPIALADPGPAPSGISGVVDGASRQVAISWNADPDPDVVGYRVRRDGSAVADVGPGARDFVGTVPADGQYAFDVQTLRWGAGGPGSPSVASPASGSFTAVVAPPAGPGTVGGGGGGGGGTGAGPGSGGPGTGGAGGTGGSGGSGGGKVTTGGSLPSAGTASPTLPRRSGSAGGGSRSSYRSGGSISRSVPTTEVDTFEERLPYEAQDSGRTVELAGPDTTRTVARTITKPGKDGPGLVVPAAVVLVLVAASLQIRSFLHRTAPAGVAVDAGPPPPEG